MIAGRKEEVMPKNDSFLGSVRRFFADYLAAVGTPNGFNELLIQASNDPKFRQQLVELPKETLEQAGIKLPQGVEVEVLENTDQTIHLVLPPLVGSEE
jgi:hypothetical protein